MKCADRIIVAAAIAVACVAGARAASPSSIEGWSSDFAATTNEAHIAHKPMVLLWGNTSCEHCEALEADVQGATFKTWRENSGYLFCFVLGKGGKDPDGTTKIRTFAGSAAGTSKTRLSSYPYVCLYWPKRDGTLVAYSFTTESASVVAANAEKYFAGYTAMPDYLGGDLAFTADYPCARLEAVAGVTTYVEVPLARDGATKDFTYANTVRAVFGTETIFEQQVAWAVDALDSSVNIPIPSAASTGDVIAVTLYGEEGTARGSVNIHIVAEPENSTKNPLFLGERTADTLAYGEWTMDLDVAMEKYNKEADSHLLAVAGGALWCPDCVMTDEHVLEAPAFKQWALDNKVILVDIDVPNFPNTTNCACLLTRVVGRTSDGYISGRGTLATNENERYQSGAGYLSRKMISVADAAAVLERNRNLVGRNTLDGGWNNPDRANQNRTGIPNFFALTRDGRLAGTFETFDAIGPSEFKEAYLNRFSELIAMADADELENRSWQTTKSSYAGTGDLGGTLSALDLKDAYRLTPASSAAEKQTVSIQGTDANTTVTVSIIVASGGEAKTLDTATGTLAQGVSVSSVITAAGEFYVLVSASGTGTLAADSAAASSVVAYTISGARAAVENPYTNEWTKIAATTTLPLMDGRQLAGTLSLTLKKNGAISAKYSNGKKNLAVFTGKWGDIDAAGYASAELVKGAYTLTLELDPEGKIVAEVANGTTTLSTPECGLATSYSEFPGSYTVALPAVDATSATTPPTGASFITLKMAKTKAAASKGTFKYTVYLANGAKLSGNTNVTWLDANFGMLPILKTSGVNAFSALLKVRKSAGTAESQRAVLVADGTDIIWTNTAKGASFTRKYAAYGSWYDSKASLKPADDVNELAWLADTALVGASAKHGTLESVVGEGAILTITDKKIVVKNKVTGFTFKLTRSTGIFAGTAKLVFSGKKQKVAATYKGILFPGWYSDCDCGEDTDPLIEMQNIAVGLGYCTFSDTANKKTVKRSFEIGIGTAGK